MARGIISFVLFWLAVFGLFCWVSQAKLRDWIWAGRQALKAATVTAFALGIVIFIVLLF